MRWNHSVRNHPKTSVAARKVTAYRNCYRVFDRVPADGAAAHEAGASAAFLHRPQQTTVARILAEIYKALGVVSKGQLIETDRAGLVAGFIGQTALKVTEVVSQAIGGVLFIDEAYSLVPSGNSGQDYGKEAVDTLVKQMEDHRDDLVVVVAGYTEEMKRFISANPGLQSRFTRYTVFEDYTPDELVRIFKRFGEEKDYYLSSAAEVKLLNLFAAAYRTRDRTFGNARLARNVFDESIKHLANRIIHLSDADKETLMAIHEDDIPQEAACNGPNPCY